jgi:hypothetical protein
MWNKKVDRRQEIRGCGIINDFFPQAYRNIQLCLSETLLECLLVFEFVILYCRKKVIALRKNLGVKDFSPLHFSKKQHYCKQENNELNFDLQNHAQFVHAAMKLKTAI